MTANITVEEPIAQSILESYALPSNLTFLWEAYAAPYMSEDTMGALWYANDTLYASNPALAQNTLGSFNTTTNEWDYVSVSGNSVDMMFGSSEMIASDPFGGVYFTFSPPGLPGFVTLDARTSESLSWTNHTTGGSEGIDVPYVGLGELVYLPMGAAGVLLLIGGYDVSLPPVSKAKIALNNGSVVVP